jgi:protein O-GlcNAc transferase
MNLRTIRSASESSVGVQPSGRARWRSALWLAAISAAAVYGLWFWWQYAHPGMTHYRQGMDYAAAHQWDMAEREWQQGIKEDPTFPGCYEKLGDLYQEGRNYPAAAAKYAAAAKLSPRDGTLFLRLARVQQKINDVQAAAAAARRAAALLPGDADANSLYGELARQIGDMPEALAATRRARNLQPDDPTILHALVLLELDTLDMAGAERDLTPWLQAHPDDAEACYSMGVVYNHKPRTPDNLQAGMDYARRAVAGLPRNPQAYVVLGQFYLDAKRPKDALQTYLAIAGSQPNNEAILNSLVDCYNRLARPDQAGKVAARLKIVGVRHQRINSLKRALNINPSNVDAGLELPRLEEEDGDREAAHADYVRILRQAPNDPRTHAGLAAFYRRAGRPDIAERAEDLDYMEDTR